MQYLDLFKKMAEELYVVSGSGYQHAVMGLVPASKIRPTEQGEQLLIKDISQFIYFYYNLQDFRATQDFLLHREHEDLTPIIMREDPFLGKRLRAANKGQGYLSPGWKIIARHNEGMEVKKEGLLLYVQPQEVVGEASALQCDELVTLRLPNNKPYASPGYYTFVSDAGGMESTANLLTRFYFHLRVEAAPLAVTAFTTVLNEVHVRYTAKILNNPIAYTRSDTMVLYISKDDVTHIYPYIQTIYQVLSNGLLPSVPAFTRSIAPGIGIAEEAQNGPDALVSFGQHRATLVARGIVHATHMERDTAEERYQCILQAFREQDLDPTFPYLTPASEDIYAELTAYVSGTVLAGETSSEKGLI